MNYETFKTSISLPGELYHFLEEEMKAAGHRNRSLIIQKALRLLRRSLRRARAYRTKVRAASGPGNGAAANSEH
jgi:Arc/MetJ-type ribon-helix-helix transcriptional regulator